MQRIYFNWLAYALCFIGYMTLMLSPPLSHAISTSLGLSTNRVHSGIGLIFLLFSLSAILLSTLSDILGVKKVLKIAQLTSICGLLVTGSADSEITFYLGCILIGSGTGSYSAIARAIVLRHSHNNEEMKHSFSHFSMYIIIAPVVASYLSRAMLDLNWRWAYYFMACIEVVLFFSALFILSRDKKPQQLIALKNILSHFKYCLSQKQFVLNCAAIGISFTLFMQVILTNIHLVLSDIKVISDIHYNLFLLGISIIYIGGILTYRHYIHLSHQAYMKIAALLLLSVSIAGIIFSHNNLLYMMISIYIMCFSLGFFIPLSTGAAMIYINKAQGIASALFTFAFALTSSIFSFIEAHSQLSSYQYMLSASIISTLLLFIISFCFFIKKN
ncbi:MFS transporter [uncultured Shewanella sp.]|uniref:MFS transporter n=1 Tax=uncultured Shewanella sp. TaxID=173975 RepID=UPI002620D9EC|nr:MFS transporter [uncultured Shewanella sp.]